MPIIKPLKQIIKDMKESFDKDSRDWKVIAGRTSNSYNDIFFCQTKEKNNDYNLWQLKAEKMSPFDILGVGTKIKNVDEEIITKIRNEGKAPYSFGMIIPQDKGLITASGPMNYSNQTVKTVKEEISNNNSLLEKLLKKRLKKLIEKEHPGRFNMFE